VDHRQHLLTERADERGRRIIGRRWARRPEQAGNHRDGDGKAPAVSGAAAARGSPARRPDAPREATMQPAEYRKLDTPEAAVYVGLSASTLSKRRVFGNGPKYLPCLRRSRSRVLHQIWIARPRLLRVASWNASVRVGWAWMVPATSSRRAPISIANVNSPMSSATWAPTAWTPSTR
jgi:hypothetical protein